MATTVFALLPKLANCKTLSIIVDLKLVSACLNSIRLLYYNLKLDQKKFSYVHRIMYFAQYPSLHLGCIHICYLSQLVYTHSCM